jgi:hypothetical protein
LRCRIFLWLGLWFSAVPDSDLTADRSYLLAIADGPLVGML